MSKVSLGGNGCTGSSSMGMSGISLLALPREVLSRIAAIRRIAELLRCTCSYLSKNVDASFLDKYDASRNGISAAVIYGMEDSFKGEIWVFLSRGLGSTEDAYKKMLELCIRDTYPNQSALELTVFVNNLLNNSVKQIESKIKVYPELRGSLNGLFERIENFKDPKKIKIIRDFIVDMYSLSTSSRFDWSQKEILDSFSKKVIEQIFAFFNPTLLKIMSHFVNFLKVFEMQFEFYENNVFSSGSKLNLPKPKDLLALRKEFLVLIMQHNSLVKFLSCPRKGGPFSFEVGQKFLEIPLKDDPKNLIVVTKDYVYLGERWDEDKSGKGARFNRDGSILYGVFDRELNFDGKGILVFGNGNDKIVFNGQMVEENFEGNLCFYSENTIYLNLLFNEGVRTKGQCRISIRFGDLNYFKIDSFDNNTYFSSKVFYFNGDVYEGNVVQGLRHGQGKMTFSNGVVYEGQFENGKFHGKGKRTNSDGSSYEGQFENGKFHGKGKWTNSDGSSYEGQFENGNFHGKGQFQYSNGDIKNGQFIEGKLHNGQLKIEGQVFSVTNGVKSDEPLRRSSRHNVEK